MLITAMRRQGRAVPNPDVDWGRQPQAGRQAAPHHMHTQPPSPLHLLRRRDVEREVGELFMRGADVAAAGADQVRAQRAAKHALRDVVCKGGWCAGGQGWVVR